MVVSKDKYWYSCFRNENSHRHFREVLQKSTTVALIFVICQSFHVFFLQNGGRGSSLINGLDFFLSKVLGFKSVYVLWGEGSM